MNLGKPEQRRLITPISTADMDRVAEPVEPPAAEHADVSEDPAGHRVPANE